MATMAQLFAQGYQMGGDIPRKARAREAAREKYGDAVDDPGLFAALQNMELAENRDSRAAQQQTFQQGVTTAREGRASEQHDFTMDEAKSKSQRDAALRVVNGLRAARDRGEDVIGAFDKMRDSLLEMGVDPVDLPEMRTQLAENPDLLDSYHAALTSGTPLTVKSAKAAQDTEKDAAAEAEGREDASEVITELRDLYTKLDEGKGITNSDVDSFSNVIRWMRSTAGGRLAGAATGTKNEEYRRSIEAIRPHLINIIKSMEGLGAKMFDSNKDMEMWLATVSDPSSGLGAVNRALDVFEARYGAAKDKLRDQGVANNDARESNQIWPGYEVDGKRFKGGNPGDPDNWENVE